MNIPPKVLPGKRITLVHEKTVPGDPSLALVPFHHFLIQLPDSTIIGHINFRIGDTPHVRNTAGHIGFQILPAWRGQAFSLEACQTLAPFIRRHYERVIITADLDNLASLKIIEKLGAVFIDEVEVPESDPAYKAGARRKKRFEWVP